MPGPIKKPSNGPSWVHESPFLPIGWREFSERGAASLKEMAMKKTLSDQRNLTPELFANIPWHIAHYLWDCLDDSRKKTLYMWKLFATAYPEQFRKITQYHAMKIEGPRMALSEYLGLVRSDSLSWGLALSVATQHATTRELVDLAEIKNLVCLELFTPRQHEIDPEDEDTVVTRLSDRIVKSWSEMVQSSGAFAHLRVLRLHNQDRISKLALQYLWSFPCLRLVVIYNCPGVATWNWADDHPEIGGWEILIHKVPFGFEGAEMKTCDPLFGCYKDSLLADCDGTEETENQLSRDTPILDFQVGLIRREKIHWLECVPMMIVLKKELAQDAKPTMEKRKLDSGAGKPEGTRGVPKRRAVMKDKKAKGLSGILSEFM